MPAIDLGITMVNFRPLGAGKIAHRFEMAVP